MKETAKLYLGFRKLIEKDKLKDFDNEFLKRKVHNYKFMIPFIKRYIDIEKLKNEAKDHKIIELLNLFDVYSNKIILNQKWIKDVKKMNPTHSKNFLFKDQR